MIIPELVSKLLNEFDAYLVGGAAEGLLKYADKQPYEGYAMNKYFRFIKKL